jgi:hypothetical protein
MDIVRQCVTMQAVELRDQAAEVLHPGPLRPLSLAVSAPCVENRASSRHIRIQEHEFCVTRSACGMILHVVSSS